MQTALAKLLETIDGYDILNPDFIDELLNTEKQQFINAWIDGNNKGWAQETDRPEDGEKYFNLTYRLEDLIREKAPDWAVCHIFVEGEGFYYDRLPEDVPLYDSIRYMESGIRIPTKEEKFTVLWE